MCLLGYSWWPTNNWAHLIIHENSEIALVEFYVSLVQMLQFDWLSYHRLLHVTITVQWLQVVYKMATFLVFPMFQGNI